MTSILGSLFVELKANTAEFVTGMSSASKAAKDAGKNIESSFSTLGSVASTALAPFGSVGAEIAQAASVAGSAARSATSEFSKLGGAMSYLSVGAGAAAGVFATLGIGAITIATRTADANARLYEQAQRAGISVEALSRLGYAAKQVGVDQDTLVRSLEVMSKAAFMSTTGNNLQSKAFKDLGISVLGANGAFKPADQLFAEIAGKLSTMADQTKRSALEMTLFGRTGAQLAPLMNLGTAAIENYGKALDKMGGTVTTQAAEASEKFKQNLHDLGEEVEALEQKLTVTLLPALIRITGALAKPFSFPVSLPVSSIFPTKAPALGSSTNPDIVATMGPTAAAAATPEQVAAQKALQNALKSTVDRLREEIATLNQSAADIDVYKLAVLGASPAVQDQVYKLAAHLQALKDDDAFQQRVGQRQKDAAKAYKTTTEAILAQIAALNALANRAQGEQFGGLVGQQGGGLSDLKNDAYDAQNAFKALQDTINTQIANHGKSDIELQIEAIEKLPGATSQEIAALKQLDAQLKSLDDSTEKVSGAWKQFDDTVARSFADIITGAEKPGKAIRNLLKQMEEMLIKKALFGEGAGRPGSGDLFGNLSGFFGANGAFKPGTTTPPFLAKGTPTGVGSATGGFLSTIGKIFGLGARSSSASSSAIVRDGNTTGSSIYVTPVDSAGNVIAPPAISGAPSDALGSTLAAGGFGGSLAAGPAIPSISAAASQALKSSSGGGLVAGLGIGLLKLLPGLAGGGPANPGSAYIVGENGPELFVPTTPGQVVSAGSGGGSGGAPVINIDARGAVDPVATAMHVRRAIQAMGNQAVSRSIALQQQNRLRTPASVSSS